MNLVQTVSKILGKEVSAEEAKEFALNQYGILCAFNREWENKVDLEKQQEIGLYKGLPLRTITTQDKQGIEQIFGVTTELVDDLITNYFEDAMNEHHLDISEVEEFDNSYMYSLPQSIFESSDREILEYINKYIDDNYKV